MIAKRIDETIRLGLAKVLKAEGFRKTGRTFHDRQEQVIRVVNVQASSGNFGDAGKFTLNLGVYFPEVAVLLDENPLESPKEYQCTWRTRIGELTGDGDLWWELDASTDLNALAAEVVATYLRVGNPWFHRVGTTPGLLAFLLEHDVIQLETVAAAVACGERERAGDVISRMIARCPPASETWRNSLRERAERWGLRIAG